NSRWNIRIHVLGLGLVASNLKVRGLEIWYGVFDMQTSKYGNSVLITSPKITSSRRAVGVPWTRFVTSAAMRGSSSTAIHFFAFSRILTVKFPEPGPTSRTMSDRLRSALLTIASAIPGFLRTCWPMSVFILNMALVVEDLVV